MSPVGIQPCMALKTSKQFTGMRQKLQTHDMMEGSIHGYHLGFECLLQWKAFFLGQRPVVGQ